MSDTTRGGGPRHFPATTWGMVSRLRDPAMHRAALEDLCKRYWKPVYLYVRAAWKKPEADAQDLTQAFFLWLLDGEPLRTYTPERGGFRTFIKVLLRRFVGHERAALLRLKRGGGIAHQPIDEATVVAVQEDPEDLLDRAWIASIVRDAVDRTRARCEKEGRLTAFRVYESYDLSGSGRPPTYDELARRFDIPWGEVKKHLIALREEVRGEIRAELAQTTADADELEAEWKALFRK